MSENNEDNLFLFDGEVEEFYSDEDLDKNLEVANRQGIEDELRRLKHWEDLIEQHEQHALEHIERETNKANNYLEKSTKSLKNRAKWHRNNVEYWLRRQPDNIRSEQFINGAVKRRKGQQKVLIKDESAAIEYLSENAPDVINHKEVKKIDKRKLTIFLTRNTNSDLQELFDVVQPEDSYTVETKKDDANV